MQNDQAPEHLHLRRSEGLEVRWQGGKVSFFPVAFLRRMSPSADARMIREALAKNPLTVLSRSPSTLPLEAVSAELCGTYAVRIRFSDGHDTGLFSWKYLREIDPTPTPSAPASNKDVAQ